MSSFIRIPDRRKAPFDYRRPCDRCGFEGWLRSQLSREEVTELLVCDYCLDEYTAWQDPKQRGQNVYRENIYKID